MIAWALFVSVPIFIGIACNYIENRKFSIAISALLPWVLFLVINIWSELFSVDREVMHNSWPEVQMIFGTLASLIGLASNLVAYRYRVNMRNR